MAAGVVVWVSSLIRGVLLLKRSRSVDTTLGFQVQKEKSKADVGVRPLDARHLGSRATAFHWLRKAVAFEHPETELRS
jgi:hypothetical protein